MPSTAPVVSPCINVCVMSAQYGVCQGCLRTIEEISNWSRISNPERQGILDAVALRRKAFGHEFAQ